MLKKLSFIAAAVGLAALAVAAFAPAASAEEPAPDVFLHGRGVLEARGDGLAAVKGRMHYTAHADGAILLVKDFAGDARIHVRGDGRHIQWEGLDVYFGVGYAEITGSDVAVTVAGNDIGLRTEGKGWAYLKGDGVFKVNGGDLHPWTEEGTFAAFP